MFVQGLAVDAIVASVSGTLNDVAEARVQLGFPLKRRLPAWRKRVQLEIIRGM
jgi:hypothetical protein